MHEYENYINLKRACDRKMKREKREYGMKISLEGKEITKLFLVE